MKTKHIVIGLIILLVIVFFTQKKEHGIFNNITSVATNVSTQVTEIPIGTVMLWPYNRQLPTISVWKPCDGATVNNIKTPDFKNINVTGNNNDKLTYIIKTA